MRKFGFLAMAVVLATGMLLGACAPAQPAPTGYPDRAAIVNPWGLGGDSGALVRAIGPYLQKYLGTTLLIETKTGGGGLEASQYVWRQPPDGTTILHGTNTMALKAAIYDVEPVYKKSYLEALIPVCSWMNGTYNLIVTRRESSIKTFEDLITEAKKRPVTFGLPSLGSTDHMNVRMVGEKIGAEFTMVPFESSGAAMLAVLGGHIDLAASNPGLALSYDPNTFNILASSATERHSDLPDVPTYAELGISGMTNVNYGAFLREGTPEKLVDLLEDAAEKAWNDEGFQQWSEDTGYLIGEFIGREAWTEDLIEWSKEQKAIVPLLKADMEKLQN